MTISIKDRRELPQQVAVTPGSSLVYGPRRAFYELTKFSRPSMTFTAENELKVAKREAENPSDEDTFAMAQANLIDFYCMGLKHHSGKTNKRN